MHKTIFLLGAALLMAVAPPQVAAQNFDTSGTAGLSGPYLFRYVNFFNDSVGNLTESCSLTGVMTFDDKGNYTLSNTQLFDSLGGGGAGSCSSLGGGTYGVQSNGIAQLDNPLYAATLFGTFSQPVLTASSTEDDYFDLFIAVRAPTTPFSTNNLSGTFTLGVMDFLDVSTNSVSNAREGYFTLSADGKGNIAPFTVTGATYASGSISQSVSASTYTLSGTTGGTLTFPGSADDTSEIVAGPRVLYVSADGNYILAGSLTGSDMIFGFRTAPGTISASLFNGIYFVAGMDANLSGQCSTEITYCLDAFYGSINTNGNGNLIWHERFDDIVDIETYDSTFNIPLPTGTNPPYDGTYYYLASANGQAVMLIGSNTQFSLNIGVRAPSFTPTSTVWINPVRITNASDYTPITNAYAPGEFVTLYGNFGVSSQSAPVLPIPKVLGGVKVFVNGQAAPVFYVSASQINALIPYEVSGDYFDTFQVQVNGSKSNGVTVYADYTAPGIYTITESGLGEGAIQLSPTYALITDSNPARPGDTVMLYMTGLGTVTPAVTDGAAGSGDSDEASQISVYLVDGQGNSAQANVLYAGLAPCCAGLYQVNFTLPSSGVLNGDDYIVFNTNEAENEMATIAVSGFSTTPAATGGSHLQVRPGSRMLATHAAHGPAGATSHRRAPPDRTRE